MWLYMLCAQCAESKVEAMIEPHISEDELLVTLAYLYS